MNHNYLRMLTVATFLTLIMPHTKAQLQTPQKSKKDMTTTRTMVSLSNSLIDYNEQDIMFNAIAKVAGKDINWTRHTHLGKTLNYHFEEGRNILADGHQTAKYVVRSRPWTYIILQEQSSLPRTSIDTFDINVKEWVDYIKDNCPNPNAKIILPMNWAYNTSSQYTAENAEMRTNYLTVANKYGLTIAPIGDVYEFINDSVSTTARKALYSDDRHPTMKATYLAALMEYATIYGEDVRNLTYVPSGVTATDAADIRMYVWKVYNKFKTENPVDLTTVDYTAMEDKDAENTETIEMKKGDIYTQNFNTLGTSATAALPLGWRICRSDNVRSLAMFRSSSTTTQYAAEGGTAIASNAKNGLYNFGSSAASTDRSIGGISTSSTSVADPNISTDLFMKITNNGLETIKNIKMDFQIEKYRNGSNAAGFTIQMYYSLDDINWTSAGDNFKVYISPDASTAGATVAPMNVYPVKSVLEQEVTAGQSIYLQWNISVASGTNASQSMALGIDDITVTADVSEEKAYKEMASLWIEKQEVKVGGSTTFSVKGKNVYGNIINSSVNGVTLQVEPSEGITVTDNSNGSFTISAKNAGTYAINASTDNGITGQSTMNVINTRLFVLDDNQYGVFFEKPDSWENVLVWCWNSTTNYTGGTWPGTAATRIDGNYYKWISDVEIPSGSYIIFNNGGNVVGETQTVNLAYVNGGFYTLQGYQTTYTNENATTIKVVRSSDSASDTKVYNLQGELVGKSSISPLPKGIYISGGKKIINK